MIVIRTVLSMFIYAVMPELLPTDGHHGEVADNVPW